MGAFLYWVEGAMAPAGRVHLEQWGIGHALGKSMLHNSQSAGPGEGTGVLLADEPLLAPYVPSYRPDEQQWQEIPARHRPPGGPRVFVGVYRDAPLPTEADLRREKTIPGTYLELTRGLRWQVPLVRSVDIETEREYSPLPSYVNLDAFGKPARGEILEAYQHLWEAATPFWDAWFAGFSAAIEAGETGFTFHLDDEVLYDSAVAMLAANYRVGPVECALGRVFASGHLGAVMELACDCEFAQVVLQKKTLAAARVS